MAILTWHTGEVPEGLKITQVYGVIFTIDGKTLLKAEEKKGRKIYSLAGGTPESFDANRVETLRRELLEEVNVTIEEPILVGYQEVDEENGKEPYAQVRMTALIKEIGPSQPDPDNGETYERVLVSPETAIELLNWGTIDKQLIEESVAIAKKEFGIEINTEKKVTKVR